MGSGVADLDMPGILRVVFGFVLTAGLAVGVAFALRRLWPGMMAKTSSSARVKAVGRSVVSRTLTVHLVEVDERRIVIAEGRTGVSVTVLEPSSVANTDRHTQEHGT
jgi:flagellar biogenesis protein FliO